jgi:hypothetical protein
LQAWDGDSPFYNITMADARPIYSMLLQHNYSMTIYNGLKDTAVPAVGAIKWVTEMHQDMVDPLKPSRHDRVDASAEHGNIISEPRRKWAVDEAHAKTEVAGWVTGFSSGLNFVTIKGAGHLLPAERPQEV